MKKNVIFIAGMRIEVCCVQTVIAGSGAAGLAAAKELYDQGIEDICIVTEHINGGTSRNTGSDKQTYYKLSLSGGAPDSVYKMAETLFGGGCMDGELALAEAAGSVRHFMGLAHMGVPFPQNRYGEFVGYKTDHDPMQRASSAGPLTSKIMTEVLQKEVEKRKIRIYSGWQIVRILHENESVQGILCIKNGSRRMTPEFKIFRSNDVIYATGGPAGIYEDSAYPECQHGASGIAYQAGVTGRNLTEWQYGIASVNPRWNVSGTYMQVLPRFISTDKEGKDEKEFLEGWFPSREDALKHVFLKGYQWPFDARKSKDGSSRVDLAVYQERVEKGRRVFLDFRNNPWKCPIESWQLCEEVSEYLTKAEACFGLPWERLQSMNSLAYEFYLKRGIDLKEDRLEIAVCAQHNNGGMAVDLWWQTNIRGLFAVGEAAGTHGIYRPGGAALNAGQVGAGRAAAFIASKRELETKSDLSHACIPQIETALKTAISVGKNQNEKTADEWISILKKSMSEAAGPIRKLSEIRKLLGRCEDLLEHFDQKVGIGKKGIGQVFILEDMLYVQKMCLSAMLDYVEHGGNDRGSAIYPDICLQKSAEQIEEKQRKLEGQVQEIKLIQDGRTQAIWRKVHPIPYDDHFFENVWKGYRINKNIM